MNIEEHISQMAKRLGGKFYNLNYLHMVWNSDKPYCRLMGNELLYPPSPAVYEAAVKVINWANFYPEDSSSDTNFREMIAEYVGLPGRAEWISGGDGSMELIDTIYKTFINEGDEVLVPAPDYTPFERRAVLFGAKVIDIYPSTENFYYSLEDFTSKITDKTKMVYLSRPNNPIGFLYPRELIESLCELNIVVVVDEAYSEFAEDSIDDLVLVYDNLIVSHTCSKAMGLAGIRFGWIVADPDVIKYVNQVRVPSNLNIFARHMAEAAIKDKDYILENSKKIISDREMLFEAIKNLPDLKAYKSYGNYVMVNCEKANFTATEVFDYFYENGFIIRTFVNSRGLPGDKFFRFSIGKHEDMVNVIDLLTKFYNEKQNKG